MSAKKYVTGCLTKEDVISQADVVYRGYCIDRIDFKEMYRIYDPEHPHDTIAYVDCLDEAKKGIDWLKERK